MERKNFNLFRKAGNFIAGIAKKAKNVIKKSAARIAAAKSMSQQKKTVEEFKEGFFTHVPPKTFGEAHQRKHGNGTRPAKKTNRLKYKAKAKRKRRKVA